MNTVAKKSDEGKGTDSGATQDEPASERVLRSAEPIGATQGPASEPPNPWAFTGGNFRDLEACSAADLIGLMFEAPNGYGQGNVANFTRNLMLATADDLDLISLAAFGDGGDKAVGRVALRASWRMQIGIEIARRMTAAAVATESAVSR